jgi:hypothetical protein
VARLQIAVDDALLARGLEQVGHMAGDPDRLVDRQAACVASRSASVPPPTSSVTIASDSSDSSRP